MEVAILQYYLKRFGYLRDGWADAGVYSEVRAPNLPDATLGEFDEATHIALRNYQAFHSLETTGELDRPTVQAMNRTRCGCPDDPRLLEPQKIVVDIGGIVGDKVVAETLPNLLTPTVSGWSRKNLTFTIAGPIPERIVTAEILTNAIAMAFQSWAEACAIKFIKVDDVGANIVVRFLPLQHDDDQFLQEKAINPHTAPNPDGTQEPDDLAASDTVGDELAHAFFPEKGLVHFLDDKDWFAFDMPPKPDLSQRTAVEFLAQTRISPGPDLITVAVHELGHALGLQHVPLLDSVMHPIIKKVHHFPLPFDKENVIKLYGPKA